MVPGSRGRYHGGPAGISPGFIPGLSDPELCLFHGWIYHSTMVGAGAQRGTAHDSGYLHIAAAGAGRGACKAQCGRDHGAGFEGKCQVDRLFDLLHHCEHWWRSRSLSCRMDTRSHARRDCFSDGGGLRLCHVFLCAAVFQGAETFQR